MTGGRAAVTGDQLRTGLAAGLRWWGRSLAALLPRSLRRHLAGLRRELAIYLDGDRLHPVLRGGQTTALGEIALTPAAPETAGATLRRVLAQRRGGYDRLVVYLDPARVLRRDIRVPLAARATLAEAVGYDLDRQTPFAPEEVFHGVRERGLDRAAGQVVADLEVVRRSEVLPALAALDAAGVQPDALRVAGGAGSDLLPEAWRRPPARLLPRATLALAAVVLVLSGLLAYLPFHELNSVRERLDRRLAAARQAAGEVQDLRSRIAALAEREAALHARRQATPLALEVLTATTEALPRNSFATHLSLAEGELRLTGYAANASDLIGQLEAAPLLEDVRFRSPVTQDNRLAAERFDLGAAIASPEEGS